MKDTMKPIGLQLYTLREMAKADWTGMLKAVADIGFVGVETAGLYDQKPADFKKVLDDLGLKVCAAHGGFPAPDQARQIAEAASILGCRHYVVSWLNPWHFESVSSIARVAAAMQAAADILRAAGVQLAHHNHEHEMVVVDGEIALARMFEKAPALAAEVDAYWATNFGQADAPVFIRRFAKRMPLLHIKDGVFDRSARVHVAVGAGRMDIPAVIAAADPNVLEWLIVELDNCKTDMLTVVRESYAYLTRQGLARGRK